MESEEKGSGTCRGRPVYLGPCPSRKRVRGLETGPSFPVGSETGGSSGGQRQRKENIRKPKFLETTKRDIQREEIRFNQRTVKMFFLK